MVGIQTGLLPFMWEGAGLRFTFAIDTWGISDRCAVYKLFTLSTRWVIRLWVGDGHGGHLTWSPIYRWAESGLVNCAYITIQSQLRGASPQQREGALFSWRGPVGRVGQQSNTQSTYCMIVTGDYGSLISSVLSGNFTSSSLSFFVSLSKSTLNDCRC